jgi:alkaline phosphatase
VALEFARKNPDTLLLVTADHETAGMSLIGHSKTSKEYTGMDLEALKKATASFEVIQGKLGKSPTPQLIKGLVKTHLGIEITDDEAKTVAADTIRKLDPANYNYPYLHSLAFVLRPYYRVGWGSQTHTASPLYLFGVGPGSERVKGWMHNTEIFTVMKAAFGE